MSNNPFDRQHKGARLSPEELGELSAIPDTMEEDMKRIESLIPNPGGNQDTEEGFQKMLNILNKTAPAAAPAPTPVAPQKSAFEQRISTPKEPTPVPPPEELALPEEKVAEKPQEPEKEKTISEQMGLNYSDDEILPIIDSLMTKGYASDTISLRNQPITFKVTYSWEEQEIIKRLDKQINDGEVNLRQTGSYFYDLYCLAASLERFGANYFPPIDSGDDAALQKSFDDRLKFLSGLASPFITILVQKRVEFMKKIQFLTDNINKYIKAF